MNNVGGLYCHERGYLIHMAFMQVPQYSNISSKMIYHEAFKVLSATLLNRKGDIHLIVTPVAMYQCNDIQTMQSHDV